MPLHTAVYDYSALLAYEIHNLENRARHHRYEAEQLDSLKRVRQQALDEVRETIEYNENYDREQFEKIQSEAAAPVD